MPIFLLLTFWQVLLNVANLSVVGIPFAFWKTRRKVAKSVSAIAVYGSPQPVSSLGAVLCEVEVDECRRWLWIEFGVWIFRDPGSPLRLGFGFLQTFFCKLWCCKR